MISSHEDAVKRLGNGFKLCLYSNVFIYLASMASLWCLYSKSQCNYGVTPTIRGGSYWGLEKKSSSKSATPSTYHFSTFLKVVS